MTNAEKGEKEKRGRRGEGTIFWHQEKSKNSVIPWGRSGAV